MNHFEQLNIKATAALDQGETMVQKAVGSLMDGVWSGSAEATSAMDQLDRRLRELCEGNGIDSLIAIMATNELVRVVRKHANGPQEDRP